MSSVEKENNTAGLRFPHATEIIKSVESGELFFAVVGHIGSGISEVANTLKDELNKSSE